MLFLFLFFPTVSTLLDCYCQVLPQQTERKNNLNCGLCHILPAQSNLKRYFWQHQHSCHSAGLVCLTICHTTFWCSPEWISSCIVDKAEWDPEYITNVQVQGEIRVSREWSKPSSEALIQVSLSRHWAKTLTTTKSDWKIGHKTGWQSFQGVPCLSPCGTSNRLQSPHDTDEDNWQRLDGRMEFTNTVSK